MGESRSGGRPAAGPKVNALFLGVDGAFGPMSESCSDDTLPVPMDPACTNMGASRAPLGALSKVPEVLVIESLDPLTSKLVWLDIVTLTCGS